MTIKEDIVTLWDNGKDKLYLFSVPAESQYNYIEGLPCITIGIAFENAKYKGCDNFTFFDHFYVEMLNAIKQAYCSLNGTFRLYDIGADTDGYIDFEMKNGRLFVNGRLGSSFSSHSLCFEFEADQTLLVPLIQALDI